MSGKSLVVAFALASALLIACGDADSDPQTNSGVGTNGPTGTISVTSTAEANGCTKFSPQSPDTHTLRVNNSAGETKTLIVELSDTGAERGFGLMNRPCLPEDSGMLFAWRADANDGFHMTDTLIPLSVAFILADGEIVHIEDMQPNTTEGHFSPVAYRYAVEVQQGWFEENGVAVGDTVEIPEVISARAQG